MKNLQGLAGQVASIARPSLGEADILVVDDDPVILNYVRLHLSTADFNVRVVDSAKAGLAAIKERAPTLIISDISMPEMDGFDFLEKVREDPETANIPFIFLTQHGDVPTMRRGMQLGANDFLSKPIRRADLLGAISSRMKLLEGLRREASREKVPTITTPVVEKVIKEEIERTGINATVSEVSKTQLVKTIAKAAPTTQRLLDGTVLFSDIRRFSTIAEQLTANEVAELLNAFFAVACEPILAQRGWIVKFVGDGVIAMFDNENAVGQHQERALKAALLMVTAANQFQTWIDNRFMDRKLPRFAIGVGLHCGEVSLAMLGTHEDAETTVLGDVVNLASRLESMTKELGWSIAASTAVVSKAGNRFVVGRSGQVEIKGRQGMADILEVTALLARADQAPDEVYDRISTAVAANTAAVAAARVARMTGLTNITPTGEAIRLDGYRLIKKLGQGGMSHVYLAEHVSDGAQHVLKMIPIPTDENDESLQRFISEYALVSQIDHPNIARIYAQGFSEAHAYISMEYFPGGDLRSLMTGELSQELAIASLIQIAGALSAIHEKGIVHRDMKPDNIMLRADGSLALVDFGIAMQMETQLHLTVAGEVYGTPAYLSPEQASDQPVDHRADIYALGIMFFEMLTGKKPYRASNPQSVLFQHVNAAIPDLPAELSHLQPLVHRMMAKQPADRFQRTEDIIEAALAVSATQF